MRWIIAAWLSASLGGTDLPLTPDQVRRQTPVVDLAPAPLPAWVPLAGEDGSDRHGYPRRYVDGPALRSLLQHRKFDELTNDLEALQAAFEADPRCEDWPADAADALGTGEADLLPLLNEWAKAHPRSFAPFLVRGTHWTRAAYLRRGGKWAHETPEQDFAGMRAAIERAMPDLDRALALRPRLVAAFRQKIKAYNAGSGTGGELRRTLDEAITACPSCFQVRVTYIYALRPRWGGSHLAMAAFAAEAEAAAASNPKLRLLRGYVDLDVAELLRGEKRYEEALSAVERACTLGEHWEFLLGRADIQARRGELEAAFADFDRASELRPGNPDVLFHRAAAHRRAKRWEAAGRDLLAGFRLDPLGSYGRTLLEGIVKGLVYEGWQHHEAGRREDALRVYDVAAALAPTSSEVQRRRAAIVTAGTGRDGVTLAQLEARARQAPDDFRSHQQLDYALARRGELDRVIVLWTEFLRRNPGHGPAHLERGGAFFHLRRHREARADAQRACELGVNEGCALAKRLRPR